MRYGKVTDEVIKKLKEIVGERYVITDRDALEAFSIDEVADKRYARMPDVIVKPRTAEEIAEIMKLANEYKIPVTPRGAGSGLSGGAIPVYGGIVISFERMNKILEIDRENLTVTVEPGVITNDIQEAVRKYGLFYPGYPMSVESCTIGGNVAENAGGGTAVKYGVTADYVMGLEVVLPTGEIIQLGGKCRKDVVGYDLIHLFIGSEGTLGIFTKITLKLLPLPAYRAALLVPFETLEKAIDTVPKIMVESKIIPTGLEFMDKPSVKAAEKYLNTKIPNDDAEAHLIIEVDGFDKESVEKQYESVGQMCLDNGAIEVYVADNPITREKVWKIRKSIPEALKVYHPEQSLEDIVVPISEIPKIVRKIREISDEFGIPIPCYGHAGDGNIHATPIKPENMTLREWRRKLPKLLEKMYIETVKVGGTISGEHGIGSKRRKYIKIALDETTIKLMKKLKRVFDPNNILNPGKIF